MSIPANSKKPIQPRSVAVLLFDGIQTLDVTGPLDVFAQAEQRRSGSYALTCVGSQKVIKTSSGLEVIAHSFSTLNLNDLDTLVIPGGDAQALAGVLKDDETIAWLKTASRKARRIASVCTGAFILSSLGLLKNKRATTHWQGLDRISALDRTTKVDRDALYTEDGKVWTSAGIAAGMDLALALVRRDLGADVALEVCRDLVIPLARSTGQSAYTEPQTWHDQKAGDLEGLKSFVEKNLTKPLTVEIISETVGLSARTFHRRCVARFNMTPARFVQEVRLERARTLLLNSKAPLKELAARVGFSDEASLSHAFKKRFQVSPAAFRAGFLA